MPKNLETFIYYEVLLIIQVSYNLGTPKFSLDKTYYQSIIYNLQNIDMYRISFSQFSNLVPGNYLP